MRISRPFAWLGGYPFAVLAVAATTAVLLPLRSALAAETLMLLYVPVVAAVARLSGVRASTASAVLAFALIDFLFVPPYFRLSVASLGQWLALFVFLVVALVTGRQTAGMRSREQAALRRQRELELLNRLASSVASEKSSRETARFIVDAVRDVLGAQRAVLYSPVEDGVSVLAEAGAQADAAIEPAMIEWVLRTNKAVGLPPALGVTEPRPASVGVREAVAGLTADGVYLPLLTTDSLEGVLAARPAPGAAASAEDGRLLVAVANLAAASLGRQRLEAEAAHAEALLEADGLKATFVSSVSHELKTPLAAATARVTGLLEEGEGCDGARVHEELGAVAEDLGRLDASIGDLLDLSRLESDAWRPKPDRYEVREILGTVSARLAASERARVRFELPEDVPPVDVDFAQLARAFRNIVENALVYSGDERPVLVTAEARGPVVAVIVEDRGPGVADAEKRRVFEKFYRGAASDAAPGGAGLGLAIAREIVIGHGGSVVVEDAEPVGARFVVTLPAAEEVPTE